MNDLDIIKKYNLTVPQRVTDKINKYLGRDEIPIPGGSSVHYKILFNYRKFTPELLLDIENVETRRFLMDMYPERAEGVSSLEQFLIDGGGQKVMGPVDETDDQSAELWSLELGNRKAYFLKVKDGTSHQHFKGSAGFDRDGRKTYILGYPDIESPEIKPRLTCMWDVVGYTYGKDIGEYRPKKRT